MIVQAHQVLKNAFGMSKTWFWDERTLYWGEWVSGLTSMLQTK
ncbi:MAG: hypothetical protein U0K53_05270 [Paludibacteraceae bacterium]|nr:hypothetical protein [Paludibacteraceae bacterium]